MARKQPIELFMPPNMLKAKVGGGRGGPEASSTFSALRSPSRSFAVSG